MMPQGRLDEADSRQPPQKHNHILIRQHKRSETIRDGQTGLKFMFQLSGTRLAALTACPRPACQSLGQRFLENSASVWFPLSH